jgi:hypothetical protein
MVVSSLMLAMVIGAPCHVLTSLKRVSGREWTPDVVLQPSPGTAAKERGSGPAVDSVDGSDPLEEHWAGTMPDSDHQQEGTNEPPTHDSR